MSHIRLATSMHNGLRTWRGQLRTDSGAYEDVTELFLSMPEAMRALLAASGITIDPPLIEEATRVWKPE